MLIAGAGASLAGCAVGPPIDDSKSLKISTYGGYFEQGFANYIYPEFTRATGIKVQSIAQPEGLTFVMEMIQTTRAGMAPIDICMSIPMDVLRGRRAGIWRTFDTSKMHNLGNLPATFIAQGSKGVDAIGAFGWYLTFVCDKTRMHRPPASWSVLWDPRYRGAWGLSAGGQSYLFEITAATWFGGTSILDTHAGIEAVVRKIGELAPNVSLWWDNEGVMQTALENQDVLGGTYYNDGAEVLAASGTPIFSTFPKEGGVIDFASWCQPMTSTKTEAAEMFIDFMCSPWAQETMARKMQAAPLLPRALMNLTAAEFGAVSSPNEPIHPNLAARASQIEFLSQEFDRLVMA